MDRRHPITDFEPERFRAFFGEQTDTLQAVVLTGGACNSNYRVSTAMGERFVCRIHQRGNPGTERTIIALAKDTVPVPEYVWVGDGVSVMSFIEGTHFEPTPELVQEAGRLIGRLSSIQLNRSGRILPDGTVTKFDGWESFAKGVAMFLGMESVASRLGAETITALHTLLEQQRHIIDSFDACRNLVHGDFNPSNILVADNRIVGVLDWEFAHSGCSYMDIGNLLRRIPAKWEQDLATGLRAEGFELPEDWRFRALLIDLGSHLEFLTSNLSDAFKQTCVDRIHALLKVASTRS